MCLNYVQHTYLQTEFCKIWWDDIISANILYFGKKFMKISANFVLTNAKNWNTWIGEPKN